MDEPNVLALIDTIYACAAEQQDWDSFLKQYLAEFPAVKPALAGYDTQLTKLNVWLIEGIPEDAARAYAEHYYKLNPWADMLQSLPLGPEVHWADEIVPREKVMKTPFYNEFVRPLDDSAAGFATTLIREPDRFLTFHANFNYDHMEEAQSAARCMNQLWPHLARAFELYRRLGQFSLYAGTLEEVLNRLTNPVFVIDEKLQLAFANEPATELLRQGTLFDTKSTRQLRLRSSADDRAVREQLAALEHTTTAIPSIYFRLQLPLDRSFVGFLSRLRLDADAALHRTKRLLLPRRLYSLFLIPPKQRIEADVEAICAVLGVTRAEARLAQALINGRSLQEHARQAQISYHTARTHMKSLIAKTEANSQAELIQRLTKIFWR